MIKEIKVTYWAVGGIIYISGCLIYIARFPERFYPGKFDLIVKILLIFFFTLNREAAIRFGIYSLLVELFSIMWLRLLISMTGLARDALIYDKLNS